MEVLNRIRDWLKKFFVKLSRLRLVDSESLERSLYEKLDEDLLATELRVNKQIADRFEKISTDNAEAHVLFARQLTLLEETLKEIKRGKRTKK